jgi:hypothetical protein
MEEDSVIMTAINKLNSYGDQPLKNGHFNNHRLKSKDNIETHLDPNYFYENQQLSLNKQSTQSRINAILKQKQGRSNQILN